MADVTTLSGKKIALGWPLCHVDISKKWFKAHNSHTPTSRSCCSFVGPCSYHSNPILPDIKIFSAQRPCRFFVQNEKVWTVAGQERWNPFFSKWQVLRFHMLTIKKTQPATYHTQKQPTTNMAMLLTRFARCCFFSIRVRLSDHKMSKTSNYLEDHPIIPPKKWRAATPFL